MHSLKEKWQPRSIGRSNAVKFASKSIYWRNGSPEVSGGQMRLSSPPKAFTGEMAERSNAAVLKTVEGHTSGGSNPSFSAEIYSNFNQSSVNTMFTGLFSFYKTSKSVLKTILLVTYSVTFFKPYLGHLFC